MAPPTPPENDGEDFQDGLNQLLQHNVRSQHHPRPYPAEDGSYIPSGRTTSFNTPEPDAGQWYIDRLGNRSFIPHGQSQLSSEMLYDSYGQLVVNPHQGAVYQGHPLAQQHHYPNPAYYSASPPPTISEQSTPPRRAPRGVRQPTSSGSRHNSPKPKRAKKNAAKMKTLSGPLSELTKDMDHIPIKDTEVWVNRSLEERREEAKKDNFVKRPSNSFILYRSAYADRARSFQKSANHQIVSSLAGESWAMEPPEIRNQYDAWAKIERENHAKAFPEYKFQPQTNKGPGRKRKGRGTDSEEDDSDFETSYAWDPAGFRQGAKKKGRNTFRESSYTPSGTSLDDYDSNGLDDPATFHASSFQMSNPGKPLPIALNQLGAGQYYQTISHPNQRFANYGYVEDVIVQPTEAPGEYHQPAPPIIGIPGAFHHELQGEDYGQNMLGHLDPMLANYDHGQSRLPQSNGQGNSTLDVTAAPQSGGFPAYSPVLNDFESDHGDVDFGSDEWWKQNKDR